MRARVVSVVLVAAALSACKAASPPPSPSVGAPLSSADIVGIWRTVHQGVLELRDNGDLVIISPVTSPVAGRYQLLADRLEVRTEGACANATGSYTVRVAKSERLELTRPDDACVERRKVLSTDPWVYTPR